MLHLNGLRACLAATAAAAAKMSHTTANVCKNIMVFQQELQTGKLKQTSVSNA